MKLFREISLELDTFIKIAVHFLEGLVGRLLISIGDLVETVGFCVHGTDCDAVAAAVDGDQNR
jgi:hypothetical protein